MLDPSDRRAAAVDAAARVVAANVGRPSGLVMTEDRLASEILDVASRLDSWINTGQRGDRW